MYIIVLWIFSIGNRKYKYNSRGRGTIDYIKKERGTKNHFQYLPKHFSTLPMLKTHSFYFYQNFTSAFTHLIYPNQCISLNK